MNPLFGNVGGSNAGIGRGIMLKALGAAMRGESPQAVMKQLATTHPALRSLDLDDLEGTADKLCREKGVNKNKLAGEVQKYLDEIQ